MNNSLLREWNKLEHLRLAIIALVVDLDQRNFQTSSGGKWSLGQILIHIVTSEKLALHYMRKKSLGINAVQNSGFIEPIKLTVLRISQRLPIKYNVPKSIHEKTPAPPCKEELLKSWEETRQELKSFLESIEEKNIHKKIFKHPIVGMLNVIQGVAFLREHLLHHKPQIIKLTKEIFSTEVAKMQRSV